jgi:carbon monoxide dehydrogenase subunit G
MKLEHRIKKERGEVFACLTDMERYVSVNPVIERFEDLGGGEYTIFERLKIGPFVSKFSYWASVKGDPDGKSVTMKAIVMKMVTIEILFDLLADGDHTVINETIGFRSFLPVKTMMGNIFEKQHAQLFLNIEKAS